MTTCNTRYCEKKAVALLTKCAEHVTIDVVPLLADKVLAAEAERDEARRERDDEQANIVMAMALVAGVEEQRDEARRERDALAAVCEASTLLKAGKSDAIGFLGDRIKRERADAVAPFLKWAESFFRGEHGDYPATEELEDLVAKAKGAG